MIYILELISSGSSSIIDIDNNNNIFTLGISNATVGLNSNSYAHPLGANKGFMLLSKQQPNGNFEFIKQIYSDDRLDSYNIAIDAQNNLYFAGTINGTKLY